MQASSDLLDTAGAIFDPDARDLRGVRIVIPGKPFAKQRPRATRQGRVYTAKETVRFEQVVAQIGVERFPAPFDGPVRLTVTAVFEPATSWTKKRRDGAMSRPHTQKPDLDNCIKALKDGLNRIAWADDAQVAQVFARKVWGLRAETIVTVEAL